MLVQTLDMVLDMHSTESVGQLNEASIHLLDLISSLEQNPIGDDDDFSLSIRFQHILEHLNLAWHYRRKSPDQVRLITQTEFDQLCSSIPNFGYSMQLLENLDP
jgi:hypothetical protein